MTPSIDQLKAAIVEEGIVDTHYHVGPELIPRKYNVATLAGAIKRCNATVVLKNHTYSTTPLAAIGRHEFNANMIGSIVLNKFVGGLNVEAVRAAISGNKANVQAENNESDPPFIVWMPTVHAQSHIAHLGFDFDPRWSGCCLPTRKEKTKDEPQQGIPVFDEKGQPVAACIAILESIAANKLILATGHLSAQEIMRLVPIALEIGVPSVILTHPSYPSVALNNAQLKELTRSDRVYIEHCLAIHTIEEIPITEFVESIKFTGPEQVLCSTDFGQIFSQPFPEGTFSFVDQLYKQLSHYLNQRDFVNLFTGTGRRALLINN